MKILLAYIAVSQGSLTPAYAAKFVGSYLATKPTIDHDTVVVCNGGPLSLDVSLLFEQMGAKFFPRVNDDGWDISGYHDVASRFHCDMLICMGESCYFWKPGWLERIVQAWEQHGPGMYGLFSSFICRPHMNTTAFVTAPMYLTSYPKPVNHAQRYEFEHGQNAFWRHVRNMGRPTMLVTWDGAWLPAQWRWPSNILFRGNQENCLVFCNHVDRWRAAPEPTKRAWSQHADTLSQPL